MAGFWQQFKALFQPRDFPGSWTGERLNTPNTLLERLYADFPFDTGLITSTGRTRLEEREGLQIFEEMSRDPQVMATYALKRNVIVSGKWVVEPADLTAKSKAIAEFVTWNLKQLLGDTALGLKPVMSAFLYGRSVSEILWKSVERGPWQGLYCIHELKPKNIGVLGFQQDDYNNIVHITLTDKVGNQSLIDPSRVVHYAWNGEFGNPYGKPDLAAVYPWWWAKKTYYKYALIYGDKFASPIPEFQVEKNLSVEDDAKLKAAARDFHVSNYFISPKGVKLALHQSNGSGGVFYVNAINSLCNAEISRAILAQTLTTNENAKTGTFAQAEVHQNTLHAIQDEIRNDQEKNVVMKQIIAPLVAVNFPGVQDLPRFRFEPFDPDYLLRVGEAMEKLCTPMDANGNAIVDLQEPWIRDRARLPERDVDKFPYRKKPLPTAKPAASPSENPSPKTP